MDHYKVFINEADSYQLSLSHLVTFTLLSQPNRTWDEMRASTVLPELKSVGDIPTKLSRI